MPPMYSEVVCFIEYVRAGAGFDDIFSKVEPWNPRDLSSPTSTKIVALLKGIKERLFLMVGDFKVEAHLDWFLVTTFHSSVLLVFW